MLLLLKKAVYFGSICLAVIFFYKGYSQPGNVPLLREKMARQQQHKGYKFDTAYINTLNKLAHGFYSLDSDSVRYYASAALGLSQNNGYLKGQADGLRMIAVSYWLKGDMPQMLQYNQQALAIAEKAGEKRIASKIITNIGFYYGAMGRYDEAVSNIKKAYQTLLPLKDKKDQAGALSDLADIYFLMKKYDSALAYNQQAMGIAHETKDDYVAAFVNSGIGKIYLAQGLYSGALAHFIPSFNYYVATKDRLGQIHTSILAAQSYVGMKQNDRAITFALPAVVLAQESKLKRDVMDAAKILAEAYENKNDIAHAFTYFKMYKRYADSVFNEETEKKTYQLEAKYLYEKKEQARKEEQKQKDLATNNELSHRRQQTLLAVLAVLLLCILVFLLFVSRGHKQRTNRLLKEKNSKIKGQKDALEIQAKELEINNRFKDKLFTIVSHDLRSPLNTMKGVLGLLQKKTLSEGEIKMLITGLDRDVNNTAELVSTLFDWASSQMKGFKVRPSTISINEIVHKASTLFATQAHAKKLELITLVPPGMIAYADNDMVMTITRNLVSNAIKFCNAGDSITITAKNVFGNRIEICIVDTGTGIKEDVRQKILNQETVTTNGTGGEKGTGLGLLLCKEFVEKNGGVFLIKSGDVKGSSFGFTLPVDDSLSP